ncbi:MAG: hypothetical protein Q9184_008263, partial [Pyrenodesmia sp. 2 TL-2023]
VNSIIFAALRNGIPLQHSLVLKRFQLIQDVTFIWSRANILIVVKALYRLPLLRSLAVIIEYLPEDKSLRTTKGSEKLSYLRGLRELKLAGKDLIERVDGTWEEVDINHPAAVGPWLRSMVMRSKPPGHEKDLEFHLEASGGLFTGSYVIHSQLIPPRFLMDMATGGRRSLRASREPNDGLPAPTAGNTRYDFMMLDTLSVLLC